MNDNRKTNKTREVIKDLEDKGVVDTRTGKRAKYNKKYGGKGGNDISWHKQFPALAEAATSIPWSWATGKRVVYPASDLDNRTPVIQEHAEELPGICAIETVIVPGTGDQASDPINIAAQALYTDIRRMLKSANQYDSSDVLIYILAVAEVRAYISWLTRIYATLMLYSHENIYLPDVLLKAQGVDAVDLHNHALEFLSGVNQAIAKASQIYIPKGFAFLDRCDWLYANYYSEGDSIKDQIYMYTPRMFRRFDPTAGTDYSSCLTPTVWLDPALPLGANSLINTLNSMIDALVGDSDFQNIAGDLMNRYGEGGVMSFSLIPQDSVITIINGASAYEVLEQMQNSRALAPVARETSNRSSDFWKVKQDPSNNIIKCGNEIDMANLSAGEQLIMEAERFEMPITVHESPSVDKTMLVTRQHATVKGIEVDPNDATHFTVRIDAAAELVTAYRIWVVEGVNRSVNNYAFASLIDDSASTFRAFSKTSPFHYFPLVRYIDSTSSDLSSVIGNLDLLAYPDTQQIQDSNRVDMLSLFAVPNFAAVGSKH